MNRILSVFVAGFMVCALVACLDKEVAASPAVVDEQVQVDKQGLELSDIMVKITSMEHTATFQLYDTNFHAGDQMHRIGTGLTGIAEIVAMSGSAPIEKEESNLSEVQTAMEIRVTANGKTTVFELNNSQAARDLYAQLPLSIEVENYSDNEKIFYPPEKLNITDAPLADAEAGTLAYYAPWGDVVMFYDSFGSAAGLYELGHAVSGSEHIEGMTGTIRIEKGSAP